MVHVVVLVHMHAFYHDNPISNPTEAYIFIVFFKNGPFAASFLFSSFLQTVNSKWMFNKSCRWLDSNQGPLVLEATALPTAPQSLPIALMLRSTTWLFETIRYKYGETNMFRIISRLQLQGLPGSQLHIFTSKIQIRFVGNYCCSGY